MPWGTGTGISEPFADRARAAAGTGAVTFLFRHQVDGLVVTDGAVTGVHGGCWLRTTPVAAPPPAGRVGELELSAQAVVLATGGIGANHDQLRAMWPPRPGHPPRSMVTGVPAHVDGRMLTIAEQAGVRLVKGPDVALHRRGRELGPDLA